MLLIAEMARATLNALSAVATFTRPVPAPATDRDQQHNRITA